MSEITVTKDSKQTVYGPVRQYLVQDEKRIVLVHSDPRVTRAVTGFTGSGREMQLMNLDDSTGFLFGAARSELRAGRRDTAYVLAGAWRHQVASKKRQRG